MRKTSLKNLATISYGKSPKQVLSQDGNIPVIGTGGVERLGNSYLFDGESIVLGRKGTIDNPIYIEGKFWAIDTTFYLHDFRETNVKWLYYFLNTVNFRSMSEATGVPSLSRDFLYSIEVPRLGKYEQDESAAVLSSIDEVLEQTEKLIAKQQRIKLGLLQDLLTKGIDQHGVIRSEATHEFKDSPLGRIPKEWEIEVVGNFLLKVKGFVQTGPFGSQLHAHEYVHDGVPVIMPQDILGEEISVTNIARITEEKANQLRRHKAQTNDVIFSRRGDLSRVVAINEETSGWLCGTGCLLMRVAERYLNAKWFASIYRWHSIQTQVEAMAVGSTMPNLNGKIISQLSVAFPSLSEQDRIVRLLSAKENEISKLMILKSKFESLKSGLMQDLLTGKAKVSDEQTN